MTDRLITSPSHRRHRQRRVRHPHHPLRDRPAGPPGRRLRRRLPRRRDHAAVGHHGRQAPQGPVRLLPADGRRRGADVRRRPHPRLVLPPRGPPERGRDPHLPADRPPAAPDASPRACATRSRSSSRSWRSTPTHLYDVLAINAASLSTQLVRPAVLRPDRRRPRRPHRRPVGRLPDPRASSSDAVFDMVVAGRVTETGDVAIMMVEAEATEQTIDAGRRRRARRRPRRSSPAASRPPSRSSAAVRGAGRAGRGGRQAGRASSRSSSTTRTTCFAAVEAAVGDELAAGADDRRQAGARGRARRASRPPALETARRRSSRAARRRSAPRSAR